MQKELAGSLVIRGMPGELKLLAGVDIAIRKNEQKAYCGIIVFSYPDLEVVEEAFLQGDLLFPYVPGLLSFREGPLFLETYRTLKVKPDLIVFDGQGIAHPRKLGIASHMSLFIGKPTIGCAKSRLYGTYEEPGNNRGDRSYLLDRDGVPIGIVLRTRDRTKPVFISPGSGIGIDESAVIMERCCGKYRIPIPTREAHIRVGYYKKKERAL